MEKGFDNFSEGDYDFSDVEIDNHEGEISDDEDTVALDSDIYSSKNDLLDRDKQRAEFGTFVSEHKGLRDPESVERVRSFLSRELEQADIFAELLPWHAFVDIDRVADVQKLLTSVDLSISEWLKTGMNEDRLDIVNQSLDTFSRSASPLIRRRADVIKNGFSHSVEDFNSIPAERLRERLRVGKIPFGDITVNGYIYSLDVYVAQNGIAAIDTLSDEQIRSFWMSVGDGPEGSAYNKFVRSEKQDAFEKKYEFDKEQGSIEKNISSDAIGIYDKHGRVVRIRIDGITYQFDDFPAPPGISKEVLEDLSTSLDLRVREGIEQDFGINLDDLTLREQMHFTEKLLAGTMHEEEELMKFTQAHGIDGARAFLSTESDSGFTATLLSIGLQHEHDAGDIFAAYGQLAIAAQKAAEDIYAEFFKDDDGASSIPFNDVQQELLSRGKRLLKKASGRDMGPNKIEKLLEQYKRDTVLFASIFKTAYKSESGVDFEDIRGMEFGQVSPQDISEEDKEQMLEIFDKNWEDQDQEVAAVARQGLLRSLNEGKLDTHFHLLKKDEGVLAYIRFDKKGDEENDYYAGSLNVNASVRGSKVGSAVMEQTLRKEAHEHVILANVVPAAVAGTHYVEMGFVIDGSIYVDEANKEGGGFNLRWDETKNPFYRAREVTTAELEQGDVEGVSVQRFHIGDELGVHRILTYANEARSRGEVITRYWTDESDPMTRYVASEPDIRLERAAA